MLYNNQSPFTTALIVPNKEQMNRKLHQQGLSIETEEGRVFAVKKIETEIAKFKKNGPYAGMLPERWLPSTFAVLSEPFTEQNQMINSTMKMVRGKIEKFYAERISYLYTSEGKDILNTLNKEAFHK
mgnify:FL=1